MPTRSCLLPGATGMVGGHVLRLLLLEDPEYATVTVLTRRTLGCAERRLVEHVVDFDCPDTYRAHAGADDVFCCLGTTIGKVGSQEAFRKVDLEYPVAIARAAAEAGARQFLIVTAVGADPKSRVFYNRTKGEVEQALIALPFRGGVKIFRPSMLLGERGESRPAERAGAALMSLTAPLFVGALRAYRAIDGSHVARAMWVAAKQEPAGERVYEGRASSRSPIAADLERLQGRRREGVFASVYPERAWLEAVPARSTVLVLGTRLSAIEATLLLCCDEGRRVVMASRSGLLLRCGLESSGEGAAPRCRRVSRPRLRQSESPRARPRVRARSDRLSPYSRDGKRR